MFDKMTLSFATTVFEMGRFLLGRHCYRLVVHADKKSVKGSDLPRYINIYIYKKENKNVSPLESFEIYIM